MKATSRLVTFLKSEDGDLEKPDPLDCDNLLACKAVFSKDPNSPITSIHFTLRVPESLPVEPKPPVKQE